MNTNQKDTTMATITVEDYALAVWQNGTNDDVWEACFRWDSRDLPELVYSDPEAYPAGHTPGLEDVAGEMLERIRATGFTVGDLSNAEVIAAIVRRYPLLGPFSA